jgi:hypothetical protein
MPAKSPPTKRTQTARSPGGRSVVQFSIFLRNKVGALLDVVKLLNEHSVQVLATSIEASADTAIVRVVVSDPESVEGVFHLHSIPYSACALVVVELSEAAQFGSMLAALLAAEVNIFGSYALLTQPRGRSALALHVEDDDCATTVLRSSGFNILTQEDLSR